VNRFRVSVVEEIAGQDGKIVEPIVRFEQVVDALNLQAVFAAVNKPPRKPRVRKPKVAPT
jgi:hypothetical protein